MRAWVLGALALAACNGPATEPCSGDCHPAGEDAGYVRPAPTPLDGGLLADTCGLAQAAFCERFDAPHPGGRGGEIDERRWAFSRWGHTVTEMFMRVPALSVDADAREQDGSPVRFWNVPTLCGETFDQVVPPNDVRVCPSADAGGYLAEVFNDNGGLGVNSMMIRQPFDFTDRTGVLVFDVDAKRNDGFDGHGWWIELWITEDPAPIPYHGAPTIEAYPRNGIGLQIFPRSSDCFGTVDGAVTGNQVGNLFVSRDYRIVREDAGGGECFLTRDGEYNHFEVRLSTDRVEVWVSDAADQSSFRRAIAFDDLDLGFSRGFVHFQHAHYNAGKTPNGEGERATHTQTYRWDNIGFDGPVYPPFRGYDVPDRLTPIDGGTMRIGYTLSGGAGLSGPETLRVEGVDLTDALSATVDFNIQALGGQEIFYRLNDHAFHAFTIPSSFESLKTLTFSLDAPIDELVSGDNEITFELREPACCAYVSIGNVDLSVQAAR